MEIFVGCSSSEDVDSIYLESARELGKIIALNGHTLVFDSSDKGMMDYTSILWHCIVFFNI